MNTPVKQTIKLANGDLMVGAIGTITATEIRTDITTTEAPWVCIKLEIWDCTKYYRSDYLEIEAFSDHLKGVMKAAGVQVWEELVGKELMTLFDWEYNPDEVIRGICSPDQTNIYFADEVDQVKLLDRLAAQTS